MRKDFYNKLREKYTEQEIDKFTDKLNSRIQEDKDNWGECCPDCKFRGQPIKACGLWCLTELI